MSELSEATPRPELSTDEPIRPLALAAVLLRGWKTVLAAVAIALLVGIVIALLQPTVYRARVTLLSSQAESSGRAQVAAQLGGLAGLLGVDSDSRLLGTILHSRVLADTLVEVMGVTGEAEEALLEVVPGKTSIAPRDDGSVVLSVAAEDPELALEVATVLPDLLNALSARIEMDAALRRLDVLERQIAYAGDQLSTSERKLVEFQRQQETPALEDQARRTLDVAATLQQQILQKELQIVDLRRSVTPNNPELRAATAELAAMRQQLRGLTAGEGRPGDVLLSLRESPELKVAASRVVRELNKDEEIYTQLTNALAQARINLGNQLPVVTVLDAARVAPSGSSTLLILSISLFLGVVTGLVWVVLRHIIGLARRNPENRSFFDAWEQLKAEVRQMSSPRTWKGGRQGRRSDVALGGGAAVTRRE